MEDTMAQKAVLLDPTRQKNWANRAQSASTGGMSQIQWDEMVPQIAWTHATMGFKGDYKPLELHPEADWQSVQLLEQWTNLRAPRTVHATALCTVLCTLL